jgi:hypothetical protein
MWLRVGRSMSNFRNVYIVVEGETESSFVREILADHLAMRQINVHPVRLGKPTHKGGNVTLERVKTDVRNLLRQDASAIVTTMLDYYGLTGNWPGRELTTVERQGLSASQKAQRVEDGLRQVMQADYPGLNVERRFIPYFAMHEFEALLFSDPGVLANNLRISEEAVQHILDECGEPEEIDDSKDNAPSKRLNRVLAGQYRKVTQGIEIAKQTGLPRIREKCPHFDRWLMQLEARTVS